MRAPSSSLYGTLAPVPIGGPPLRRSGPGWRSALNRVAMSRRRSACLVPSTAARLLARLGLGIVVMVGIVAGARGFGNRRAPAVELPRGTRATAPSATTARVTAGGITVPDLAAPRCPAPPARRPPPGTSATRTLPGKPSLRRHGLRLRPARRARCRYNWWRPWWWSGVGDGSRVGAGLEGPIPRPGAAMKIHAASWTAFYGMHPAPRAVAPWSGAFPRPLAMGCVS